MNPDRCQLPSLISEDEQCRRRQKYIVKTDKEKLLMVCEPHRQELSRAGKIKESYPLFQGRGL